MVGRGKDFALCSEPLGYYLGGMSEFRFRGIEVVVDTTLPADFQIKGYQLSDVFMDRVARGFKAAPLRAGDKEFGPVMVRCVEGYDFLYVVGRQEGALVVTIGDVWPTEEMPKIEQILQKGALIAMLRGASGL